MAECVSRSKAKTKLTRYVKTSIPVCSTEYKKVVKEVKEKRKSIEDKAAEIENLKFKFEDLQVRDVELAAGCESDREDEPQPAKYTAEPKLREPQAEMLIDRFGGTVRQSIVTPGGHKRKVKPAHEKFKFELKEALAELVKQSPGEELLVDELMTELETRYPAIKRIDQAKVLATISKIFQTKLQRRGKKRQRFYKDLSLRIAEDNASSAPDQSTHQLPVDSPLRKISRQEQEGHASNTSSCRAQLNFAGSSITDPEPSASFMITEEYTQMADRNKVMENEIKHLEETLARYKEVSQEIISKQTEVIQLYEDIVGSGNLLGGILSLSERQAIKAEVKKAKELFNLHIRSSNDEVVDMMDIIDPLVFAKLLVSLRNDCPTIVNILEQLVLSENTSRNKKKTEHMKMTAAVHLLSSLLDVRDQNGKNDIQILFGLLCISYGAGSTMIAVLQHIGLCESFPFLCSVLKQQLDNYKTLIKKRVPADIPVITYQDNMQLKRTSLRHLRLSKLQQDKTKQNKFWDFTVRGWRVADISGIEDLFKDEKTAKAQQLDLDKLKYEDVKIECNKEHSEKWADFKARNLLRKMDVAFNMVPLTSSQLANASSDQLKGVPEGNEQQFLKIEVPPIPEEFPKLSRQQTAIYPLPLSYENQCKTLGLGRNLDLFAEEFEFKCQREKKFLPKLKSKQQFNLQLAYDRYAFLRSMEKHKEKQTDYESFLRNTDSAQAHYDTDDEGEAVDDDAVDDNEADSDSELAIS